MNIDMISVEGGNFLLGKVTPIDLSDFKIGKTPVTVEQYMEFVEDTKSHYPEWLEPGGDFNIQYDATYYKKLGSALQADNNPIIGISWNDAVAFCDWLSKKTGVLYRLPTEAEWEYAARGGNQSKNYRFAGSNNLAEVGWYCENSGSQTHPVAQKKPNELGLYDMSGNVAEWCWDWASDTTHVLRGGSWDLKAAYCRITSRDWDSPKFGSNDIGFRIAI